MNTKIASLTQNAIVAALYVALTFITLPFSYGPIQVRLSEVFVLLCFFNPSYVFGVTTGCLIANIYSAVTLSPLDLIFGTLATFLACFITSKVKHLLIGGIINCLLNSIIIGLELTFYLGSTYALPFNCLFVLAGEIVSTLVIGYTLMMTLGKKQTFQNLIRAKQNKNFSW